MYSIEFPTQIPSLVIFDSTAIDMQSSFSCLKSMAKSQPAEYPKSDKTSPAKSNYNRNVEELV